MCSICSALVLILVIILIVMVATFKRPTFTLASLEKSTTAPSKIVESSIDMTWNAGVKITNQNIFDLEFTDFEALGSLETAPSSSHHLVKGLMHNVKIGKGTTEFKVPMDFKWSNATDKDGKIHTQLVKSCKTGGEQLPMQYQVFAAVKVWGIGPFKLPNIQLSQKQTCPFDIDAGLAEAAKMETKSADDADSDDKPKNDDDSKEDDSSEDDNPKDEDEEDDSSKDEDNEDESKGDDEEEEKPKPRPSRKRAPRRSRKRPSSRRRRSSRRRQDDD